MGSYDSVPAWPAGHEITDDETAEVLALLSGTGDNGGLLSEAVYERLADSTPVTNSATLVNDTVFSFPALANAHYDITGLFIYVATSTTGLFKCGWTVPAGATFSWVTYAYPTSVTSTPGAIDLEVRNATNANGIGISATNASTAFSPRGRLLMGSTAGTVQFQFAQNTAVASTSVTMKSGSYLLVKRIA